MHFERAGCTGSQEITSGVSRASTQTTWTPWRCVRFIYPLCLIINTGAILEDIFACISHTLTFFLCFFVSQDKLSRAKSAEDLSVVKEEDSCFQNDLKGYTSDSTVSCSNSRHLQRQIHKKRRNYAKKRHPTSSSDPTLKKDTGFFHSLGTRLLINSNMVRMSSSRLLFKGSDNALYPASGGSFESLAPPETKQRRKMPVNHKQHLRLLETPGSLGNPVRKIGGNFYDEKFLKPVRRWSLEKLSDDDDGNVFCPLITVTPVATVKENDGKGFSCKRRESFDVLRDNRERVRENSKSDSMTCSRRGSFDGYRDNRERMREDCKGYSMTCARKGSLNWFNEDPERVRENGKNYSANARRGSFDILREDHKGPTFATFATARRSVDGLSDDFKAPLLLGRRGSLYRTREDNSREPCSLSRRVSHDQMKRDWVDLSSISAIGGSVQRPKEESKRQLLVTARTVSLSSGEQWAMLHSPLPSHASHARKRRSKSKDDNVHMKTSTERLEKTTHTSHMPFFNTLKGIRKKSTSSKQDKVCKSKALSRSHSFSSVEDIVAGPCDRSTRCSDTLSPHPDLAWSPGNKWVEYGYL